MVSTPAQLELDQSASSKNFSFEVHIIAKDWTSIKVKEDVVFRVSLHENFERTMQSWCDSQGLHLRNISFTFQGISLQPTDSLQSVGWTPGHESPKVFANPRRGEQSRPRGSWQQAPGFHLVIDGTHPGSSKMVHVARKTIATCHSRYSDNAVALQLAPPCGNNHISFEERQEMVARMSTGSSEGGRYTVSTSTASKDADCPIGQDTDRPNIGAKEIVQSLAGHCIYKAAKMHSERERHPELFDEMSSQIRRVSLPESIFQPHDSRFFAKRHASSVPPMFSPKHTSSARSSRKEIHKQTIAPPEYEKFPRRSKTEVVTSSRPSIGMLGISSQNTSASRPTRSHTLPLAKDLDKYLVHVIPRKPVRRSTNTIMLAQSSAPTPAAAIVDAFFSIVMGSDGSPEAYQCWPNKLRGSRLEQAVVRDGFCPNPILFGSAYPKGFGQQPAIFSILETTLDPEGDANGMLYGCVCSASIVDSSCPTSMAGVLCVISRLPLFELLFDVLNILERNLNQAEDVLSHLNNLGMSEEFVVEGMSVEKFSCDRKTLNVRLPRPLQFHWSSLSTQVSNAEPLGLVSQTFTQWQAAWCFMNLFIHFDNLVGDTLAKLLASVLLEQKVLLLGDAGRISTIAILLRALIWPFRWLHPFLSAPPPLGLLSMPLLDATFPIIVALTEFPSAWGYKTPYDLPPDVITGVLQHDYVHISPELETAGGLKGGGIKLPGGRHTVFVKQVAKAKQLLRKKELAIEEAVSRVQEAAEAEVARLADLIRRYASCQLGSFKISEGDTCKSLEEFQHRCSEYASDCDNFRDWLCAQSPRSSNDSEVMCFYETFFQTQACMDFLHEELLRQTTKVGS